MTKIRLSLQSLWSARPLRTHHWPIELYTLYLYTVSILGVLLFVGSLQTLPTHLFNLNFWLLGGLAIISVFVTTSVTVEKSGITYAIGSVISMAALYSWGIGAGILINTLATSSSWLIKPTNRENWKKSWTQLFFNLGMLNITLYCAGTILLWLLPHQSKATFVYYILSWGLVAWLYAEINLGLLIGILRLQHGSTFQILHFWREERWSTAVDVAILMIGGGLLALAVTRFDWQGIVIFFLPVLLSAYAFRLYVSKMRAHLENLEEIVAERTESLQEALTQLQAEMEERARIEAELRHLATYDSLTNALNRRSFFAEAHEQFAIVKADSARNLAPLAILMFDLDRFKQINDRYGHAAGDAALRYFAKLCMEMMPAEASFGRLGGEEFALLLPDADLATASALAERIRIQSPTTAIPAVDTTFVVHVSIGVTQRLQSDTTIEQMLERADQQLYLAKAQGGDCVCDTSDIG